MKFSSTLGLALTLTALAPFAAGAAAPEARPRVVQAAELPAHRYAIAGKPSEVLGSREAVQKLAQAVERDLKADLEQFDIQDKASLMSLYGSLYVTGMLLQDYAGSRHFLTLYRELVEDPTQRLTAGLLTEPLMQAHALPQADLRDAYRRLLSERLAALPFAKVSGVVKGLSKRHRGASKELMVTALAATLDPAVQDGRLSADQAGILLAHALNLHVLLPVRDELVACLEALLAAHPSETTAGKINSPRVSAVGAYFGQTTPGEVPVLFAPEVLGAISSWVSGIAFSPDGTECFLHVGSADYSGARMYYTRYENGRWSDLVEPAFLAGFSMSAEPVFSKDGNTLLFTGRRDKATTDFWTVNRSGRGWGSANAMPAPINSEANEFRGSFANDGSFYFGSERTSPGINQVFKARKNASQAWEVTRLGAPINALSYDGDPLVAPDGRFLVYYAGRSGGFGRVDLYVSFADGKGGWATPINLGPAFNSPDDEFGAHWSADGKFMFFTRHTAQGDQLFWVATTAIDKLNPAQPR